MVAVSLIMPAYRAEETIARAVASVLAQRHADFELLIVADDNADYRALLSSQGIADPRLVFLTSGGVGTGPGRPRNVALARARGAVIAPIDADDAIAPERLERLLPIALAEGWAASNVRVRDEVNGAVTNTLFALAGRPLIALSLRDYLATNVPVPFMFRRDAINQPWPEDIRLGEDLLFSLQACDRATTVTFLRMPTSDYFVRQGSVCHSSDSAALADASYVRALERLRRNGFGLNPANVPAVIETFEHKRLLNRAFAAARARGEVVTFQEFVAREGVAAGAPPH